MPQSDRDLRSPVGCLGRWSAVLVMVGAVLVAAAMPIVLHLLRSIGHDPSVMDDVPPGALWWMERPLAGAMAALPAILLAGLALRQRHGRVLWMALASVAMVLPLAVVLWCFIATLAPLYQYRSL